MLYFHTLWITGKEEIVKNDFGGGGGILQDHLACCSILYEDTSTTKYSEAVSHDLHFTQLNCLQAMMSYSDLVIWTL